MTIRKTPRSLETSHPNYAKKTRYTHTCKKCGRVFQTQSGIDNHLIQYLGRGKHR